MESYSQELFVGVFLLVRSSFHYAVNKLHGTEDFPGRIGSVGVPPIRRAGPAGTRECKQGTGRGGAIGGPARRTCEEGPWRRDRHQREQEQRTIAEATRIMSTWRRTTRWTMR